MNKRPLILVVNDDGYQAKGLLSLIEVAKTKGDVLVVAPDGPRSGMSHAITMHVPLRLKKIQESENFNFYITNGTPVDCVKLAQKVILNNTHPNLIISGINHGSNSAISVHYSGTMGAALEGAFENVPSIGFSLLSFDADADFSLAKEYAGKIIDHVLKEGLPERICLNVNFPYIKSKECNGIKITRQAKGYWSENLIPHQDPHGGIYYWLTGVFVNLDGKEDTDEWALANNYVSVHPVQFDLSAHAHIDEMKHWESKILQI